MQAPGAAFDVDMEAASPVSGVTDGGDSSPSAQRVKPRKPTYIVRKEEKAQLLEELKQLQSKLRELQQDQVMQAERVKDVRSNLLEQELATSLLRDAVRIQQFSLVNVQSAVSGYVSVQDAIPHEMTISLNKNQQQRRDTLIQIKPRKLRLGIKYLAERTRFLDPFRPFAETSRFLLDSGDYCVLRVDMTPIDAPGVTVRQVFDGLLGYFSSMEMRVTDILGDITTCDETNYGVDGIQQVRCISRSACGVDLESNSVMSWEFTESSAEYADGGPLAVVTADSVDQDDLHQYSPHERVRQDTTSVITVRSHTRQRQNSITGAMEEERVVVLTRSCFLKLYRTEIAMPSLVQHQLREQLGKWGDVMLSSVIEHVHTRQHV